MQFILFLLFFLVCIFTLYVLSKNDFVLLRQNISLPQIFDLAIVTFIFSFVSSRLLYIIDTWNFSLFHPIKFFHLVKFPGFSPLGFFAGGAICLFILSYRKKGLGRIYDIFAIAFLPIYSFSLITRDFPKGLFLLPTIFFIIVFLIFITFIKWHQKYNLKDGSIAIILLILLTLDSSILQSLSINKHNLFSNFSFVQLFSAPLFFISILALILNQKFFKKI